jgi:predicted RND superfamily exporter protein
VLGFSSLLLAESPGLQLLGGIVAVGSVLCMLSCLFVLAPLLARLAKDRQANDRQGNDRQDNDRQDNDRQDNDRQGNV